MDNDLKFFITLWPDFKHFSRFARDDRLSGIRLNRPKITPEQLGEDFGYANSISGHIPFYFDIKGRQLRIEKVFDNKKRLILELNRKIKVKTPTMVLFKSGEDYALLERVYKGKYLIFNGGPKYMLHPGDSLNIRDRTLEVEGPLLMDYEIKKLETAKKAGFNKYFLSYVESQKDIDAFKEYVGDSEIVAKIENPKGLEYVVNEFKKQDNLWLLAARGDLYVEIEKPHHIIEAQKIIINKDPEAGVGSRILLSTVNGPVPSCADLAELAWLYDIGYKKMMFCDELCLKEEWLARALNVVENFKQDYVIRKYK